MFKVGTVFLSFRLGSGLSPPSYTTTDMEKSYGLKIFMFFFWLFQYEKSTKIMIMFAIFAVLKISFKLVA